MSTVGKLKMQQYSITKHKMMTSFLSFRFSSDPYFTFLERTVTSSKFARKSPFLQPALEYPKNKRNNPLATVQTWELWGRSHVYFCISNSRPTRHCTIEPVAMVDDDSLRIWMVWWPVCMVGIIFMIYHSHLPCGLLTRRTLSADRCCIC